VFVFDDVHLSAGDLMTVQQAGVKMLAESLADTDVAAVVSLSGQTNSGLIQDRARLKDAIMSLKRHPGNQGDVSDCPKLDYFQAYQIATTMDNGTSSAFSEAVDQILQCDPQTPSTEAGMLVRVAANRVVAIGAEDVRATYAAITDVVRKMANLPGQRTMILVSPGFLSITPEAAAEGSQVMDLAAQSNVTISALDARGLYTTNFGASEDLGFRAFRLLSDANYRGITLTLSEDPMAGLAQATGGTFFHNSNDLGGGFKKLTEAPETVYVLELPLDNVKPDGNFHAIKVTVDGPGMEVQARPGYFMAKAAKNKK
jgi:VWFA-related protein